MGASFNPPSDTTMSIPPQPPKLDLTFGAFLIGTFISVVLYGGVLQQSHRYIRFYAPEDTAFVKAIVALILVTETTGVATCIHACYHYLVTNYANPAALQFTCWSLNLQSALVGLVIFLAQTFYARRVYLLRPGYAALVAIAVSLSILSLVFGTAASVLGFSSGTFPTFRQYTWLDSVGLSTAVMSDLLTTSVLVVFLARSRTGFQKTDHILDRLIQYLLNTGLLIGILNVVGLVLAIVSSGTFIYFAVGIVGTRVYSNSVLAALNTRDTPSACSSTAEDGQIFGVVDARRDPNISAATPRIEPQVLEWGIGGGGSDAGIELKRVRKPTDPV